MRTQLNSLAKELDQHRKERGGPLKQRTECSDKGKKRGPWKNTTVGGKGKGRAVEEEEDNKSPTTSAPPATTIATTSAADPLTATATALPSSPLSSPLP